MPKLPAVSGRKVVAALKRAGFVFQRQSGSHVILKHPDTGRTVSVPSHSSDGLPPGTLRGVLRQAGMSVEELRPLLG